MSELKSREDIANEYFKCQQITDYQKAFEEIKNRDAGKGPKSEGYLAMDSKAKKDSCCHIL